MAGYVCASEGHFSWSLLRVQQTVRETDGHLVGQKDRRRIYLFAIANDDRLIQLEFSQRVKLV